MRNLSGVRGGTLALFVAAVMVVPPALAGAGVTTIDTARLHSMVMDNAYRLEGGRGIRFPVIDARTKKEYGEAHIFSAISIPEGDFERSRVLLPKDKTVLLTVYCDGGGPGTCRKWADKAAAAGYANLVIYSEGFSAWKENHMPVAPLTGGP